MSKNDLKDKIVKKCEMNFGFAPTKNNITILESDSDGNHIKFRVYINKYKAHSEYQIDGINIRQTLRCTGATPRDF